VINWERVARAHVHTIRLGILEELAKNRRPKSPKELSKLLKADLSKVSYHFVELAKAGLIELERTEPRRGAVEHYYRLVRA
jgi:predicted transcriptional regulator